MIIDITSPYDKFDFDSLESLYHEKSFTQSTGPLPQYLIRWHGQDGAESEGEGVHVFHVEVVGSNCIRHAVCAHLLSRERVLLLSALQSLMVEYS